MIGNLFVLFITYLDIMKPQINMAEFTTFEESDYWGSLGLRTVLKDIKSEIAEIELVGSYMPRKLLVLEKELGIVNGKLLKFNN